MTIATIIALSLRILINPLSNVFQKRMTQRIHPLAVNSATFLLLALCCLPALFFISWGDLPLRFWLYTLLTGIFCAAGNGFLVWALETGDLSVLGPINAYKSVIGLVAGAVMLRELPNPWGLLGVALIVGGSYFVLGNGNATLRGSFLRSRAIRYRFIALLFTAVEAVFIKQLILLSSVSVAFVVWVLSGAFFSWILMRLSGHTWFGACPRDRHIFWGLVALAGCVGLMQVSTNYVFAHMEVGYALALFQLSAVVSVVFGYRFFREQEIPRKLFGSLLMAIGAAVIVLV